MILERLHETNCIVYGDFLLTSGKPSKVYIDIRRAASYPDLLKGMQTLYTEIIRPIEFDRLLAVPHAGLPIGAVISLALEKPLLFNRTAKKRYGLQLAIEGSYQRGDKIVIVDDLITTGKSVLQAIALAEDEGLQVEAIVVLIARRDFDGVERLTKEGYRVEYVYEWCNDAFH